MKHQTIPIKESDLKYGVQEYLQYGQNMGQWLSFRLNSGQFLVGDEGKKRRIKGAPAGTADFVVFRRITDSMQCRTIFLETKSSSGNQTAVQKEFELNVKAQGAEYYLIKSLAELFEILPI